MGRDEELAFLEQHLVEDPPASVVFLHGPRGIGKSALLRELARRAERRGLIPHWIDGRTVPPSPDALEEELAAARVLSQPLIILDSFERIAGAVGQLRRALLPSLPRLSLVLIASRAPPADDWFQGGWEMGVAELEIGPLSEPEAIELLRARGVGEAHAVDLAAWAGGSPLELTLTAELSAGDPSWRPESAMGDTKLVDLVIRRLAGGDIDDERWDTLAAAAIARRVTAPLLRDVLPDQSAAQGYEWLRSRSFVQSLGEGLAVHHFAREALRADLRRRDPERDLELRRRIADHLYEYERSRGKQALLAIDLSHLIEDPRVRCGFSWSDDGRMHLDHPRPGDAEAFESLLGETRHKALWRGSSEYFDRAPGQITIARHRGREPAGYVVAVTPASAPEFASDDPVLGPRLEHARRLGAREDAVVVRDLADVTGDSDPGITGMLGVGAMLRATEANPRWSYVALDPLASGGREFVAAIGGQHLPELDVSVGEMGVECHLVDHGPGGMLAHERELVYRELGLAPPDRESERFDVAAAVLDALRNLQRPDLLARSQLARGQDMEERARYVRGLLGEAAERAFGTGPGEDLLRRVLVRGYLDPAPTRELAAEEVSLSRSAYFRRLRAASERVASYVSRRLEA